MDNAVTLSLITGAMDRPQSLYRLITSIKRHTIVEWELIVSDASEVAFWNDDPHVTMIRERPPLGHTKGYNNAFKVARGQWVLWLNDDAEVLPLYDVRAIEFMKAHPTIALGALPYSELRHGKWSNWHTNDWRGIPYANFGIIKRSLGDVLGWFDEDFYMYGADNSLAFRVLLAGYGISPIPGAYLLHHSPQDDTRAKHQKWRAQAAELFDRKYTPRYNRMHAVYRQYKIQDRINEPYGLPQATPQGTAV